VDLSADGRRALTRDFPFPHGPGTVQVWDTATGKQLASTRGQVNQSLTGAFFYPDSQRVVLARGGINQQQSLALWDPRNGSRKPYLDLERLPTAQKSGLGVGPARLSADGELLAFHYRQAVILVHTRSGNPRRVVNLGTLTMSGLDVRPDGQYFLCAGGASQDRKPIDCFTHIVSVKTGREVCRLSWPTNIFYHALFTADGRQILASAHDELMLWQLPKLE